MKQKQIFHAANDNTDEDADLIALVRERLSKPRISRAITLEELENL